MASKLGVDLKDDAELQKEMCMSSLKRALDDVEYSSCAIEPLKKKTCVPISKKHIRGSANVKRAKVSGRTHCKLQNTKKTFQKSQQRHTLKAVSRTGTSKNLAAEKKKEKTADIVIEKKRSKRSADSLPNHTTEDSDQKKRKVEQTATEADLNNCQDSTKTTNEPSTTDATFDTSQQTESPELGSCIFGFSEYDRAENQEYLLQQNYSFQKNVAFARKTVVYSSDGSEYDCDYSDVDGVIGDDDDDDDDDDLDDYDALYDIDDLDDEDDNYEDIDPDAEVVSKRLNLQIADFFKLYRSYEPDALKTSESQSGEEKCTDLCPTSSFGMGLFYESISAGSSSVAAAAAAAGGFEHDENGNDAEEFDRASAASINLQHAIPL